MIRAPRSPSNGGGGCLLAVVTNAHHVSVHAPRERVASGGEWETISTLSETHAAHAERICFAEGGRGGGDLADPETSAPVSARQQRGNAALSTAVTRFARRCHAFYSLAPPITALPSAIDGATEFRRGVPHAPSRADALAVGATVEVRRLSACGGGGGGWIPGLITDVMWAFNFRIKVKYETCCRGGEESVKEEWIAFPKAPSLTAATGEAGNEPSFGSKLEPVATLTTTVTSYRFPPQSQPLNGPSRGITYFLRPSPPAVVGMGAETARCEIMTDPSQGWIPAVINFAKRGSKGKPMPTTACAGVEGVGDTKTFNAGRLRSRERVAWDLEREGSGDACAWRPATNADYDGTHVFNPDIVAVMDDKEAAVVDGDTGKGAAKSTTSKRTSSRTSTIINRMSTMEHLADESDATDDDDDELKDDENVKTRDGIRAATQHARSYARHRDSAVAAAVTAAASATTGSSRDKNIKRKGDSVVIDAAAHAVVDAVFGCASLDSDTISALTSDGVIKDKGVKARAKREISARVRDAFLAARGVLSIDERYEGGAHLRGMDKVLLECVLSHVWAAHMPDDIKNGRGFSVKELSVDARIEIRPCVRALARENNDADNGTAHADTRVGSGGRARRQAAIAAMRRMKTESAEDDDDRACSRGSGGEEHVGRSDVESSDYETIIDSEEASDAPDSDSNTELEPREGGIKRKRDSARSCERNASTETLDAYAGMKRAAARAETFAATSIAWSSTLRNGYCVLAVGTKSGAVVLWSFDSRSRLREDGAAPKTTLLGAVLVATGWVNALRWIPRGNDDADDAEFDPFMSVVIGSSDGSVSLWTTSDAFRSAASSDGNRALDAGALLTHAVRLRGPDDVATTVISCAHGQDKDGSVESVLDTRSISVAAGMTSGDVLTWRIRLVRAENGRVRVIPGDGLRTRRVRAHNAACAGIAHHASARVCSISVDGDRALISELYQDGARGGDDDALYVIASDALRKAKTVDVGGGAVLSAESHAGLAISPCGVLLASCVSFTPASYLQSTATSVAARTNRGMLRVEPPQGEPARDVIDAISAATRALPFASEIGSSLWDLCTIASDVGIEGGIALASAADELAAGCAHACAGRSCQIVNALRTSACDDKKKRDESDGGESDDNSLLALRALECAACGIVREFAGDACERCGVLVTPMCGIGDRALRRTML